MPIPPPLQWICIVHQTESMLISVNLKTLSTAPYDCRLKSLDSPRKKWPWLKHTIKKGFYRVCYLQRHDMIQKSTITTSKTIICKQPNHSLPLLHEVSQSNSFFSIRMQSKSPTLISPRDFFLRISEQWHACLIHPATCEFWKNNVLRKSFLW